MQLCRPREKLLRQGAAALSDIELLAIFLRTGSVGKNVMELAAQMLATFGSLDQVLLANPSVLRRIKGVGDAKITQLHAIAELAQRVNHSKLFQRSYLENPQLVYQYLVGRLAHKDREIFEVIFLDNQHRVISAQTMFLGSIGSVEVHPREIIREALKQNAAALILAHNHPSGVAEPSEADKQITDQINLLCQLLNLRLLDHFVIGKGEFVSFAERGFL